MDSPTRDEKTESEAAPSACGGSVRSKSQTAWVRRALLGVMVFAGCARSSEPQFVSGPEAEKLEPAVRAEVEQLVNDRCGTAAEPHMLGDASYSVETLRGAAALYAKRCSACHGVSGDGNGPAAATLLPKPRDYRKGIFKFTSTPYGQRPLRDDLLRTIRRGVPGTSMPSFELLPQKELDALVNYVQLLSMRGEYETALAIEATDYWEDAVRQVRDRGKKAIHDDVTQAFRKAFTEVTNDNQREIPRRWERAIEQRVTPLTPQPVFTAEHVVRGRQFFLDQASGCMKCHGTDGRGQTPENIRGDLKDVWGHPTQAADLTSGRLRGGSEPVDIYRRIYSGISGTPMPGFAGVFAKEPDRIWDVVAFVLYITNERRRGEIPDAATGPMPGRATLKTAAGEAHP